jgi:hypothetical protein
MTSPKSGPPVADEAPSGPELTEYDRQHLPTYLRLLDAEAEGADWREVARVVLRIDPLAQRARAHKAWTSHLARARWMRQGGYRKLLPKNPGR